MTNIIACIDGSSYSQSVADLSIWTAQTLSAPLTLLHVLDKSERETEPELSGNIGLGSREHLLQELIELDEKRAKVALRHGKALLNELETKALESGFSDLNKLQKHGDLLETLLDMEQNIRVLVVGKSGEMNQSNTKAVGSQLESVVRTIKSHILVATGDFTPPDSYLLAFDGSEISQKLVEKAIKTPLLKGMKCHLVMVEDANDKAVAFAKAAQKLRENGIEVVEASLTGEVHRAILDYQEKNALGMIVMGAYGHSKLRQFFVGSNTTKIIVESNVPLLLIR
ncbi:universal stress protein [Vibrio cincinnatiensis]|uniref:Nucleotide-binding universal stress protein, UspA family n=1 Tax=Vibrio cincinnatiensis DSM 19608 TaxID=1123491 RepID=A0A1T4K9R8_VIBCI|nr:universal stress protein [Vibrio cincinnatiensis]MCG3723201.1 universal stress protein [Vibrio cincinnatiensis]MCG3734964.1 universal stress protein [Vibrio cincinnatiensis]SJZ39151.1 Nucleotide-binding universal stress protein, UspA family [Vibrio cincinnatiensis DSM 19608]SUP48735.1 Universal stress protein family [Vibrio cincinnatiensis]